MKNIFQKDVFKIESKRKKITILSLFILIVLFELIFIPLYYIKNYNIKTIIDENSNTDYFSSINDTTSSKLPELTLLDFIQITKLSDNKIYIYKYNQNNKKYYSCNLVVDTTTYNNISDDSIMALNIDSDYWDSAISNTYDEYEFGLTCNSIQTGIDNDKIKFTSYSYDVVSDIPTDVKIYANSSDTFDLDSAKDLLTNIYNKISFYGLSNKTLVNYIFGNDLKSLGVFSFNKIDDFKEENKCYKSDMIKDVIKYYYGPKIDFSLSNNSLVQYNPGCGMNYYTLYNKNDDCYVFVQGENNCGGQFSETILFKVNNFHKDGKQYILKCSVIFIRFIGGTEDLAFSSDFNKDAMIYSSEENYSNMLLEGEEYLDLFDENDEIDSSSIGYQKIIKDPRLKEYSYIFEEYDGYYYYKGAVEN